MRPLSDALRSARQARGLTQRELAERIGVSTRLVAEFERGERANVSLATALALLAEVGVRMTVASDQSARNDATYSTPDADRARRVAEQTPALRVPSDYGLLDDVPRILALSPEDRLREVANMSRFVGAVRRA